MPKFIFVRHGYSCTNAMSHLVESGIVKFTDANQFLKYRDNTKTVFDSDIHPLDDPVLTNLGVDASMHNGRIVNKLLKTLLNINKINIIGCSPLIRAMETAYYMSRKWVNPPNKIYVLPFLREIDERSSDKFSEMSIKKINTSPGYSMKSLPEQKAYLKKLGILDFFDFSFVEAFPEQRLQPGDINLFLKWFATYYLPLVVEPVENLSIFIVSHAGVLRDFNTDSFYNNSGFVTDTTYEPTSKNLVPKRYFSLQQNLIQLDFFTDYTNPIYNQEYYCPSERCGQLCSVINVKSDKLKTLKWDTKIKTTIRM
jgi:hypothetical protein